MHPPHRPRAGSQVRPRATRRVVLGAVVLLALFLSGCAKDAPQDTFAPEGKQAKTIDRLQEPIFMIAGVVGLIVFLAVFIVILRFRAKRYRDDDVPEQIHGKTGLEIAWTLLPAILMAGIAVPTLNVVFELARNPSAAMQVDVYGQQWWWEFDYRGTEKGVRTANDVVIPVDTDVTFNITSRDVIHSFWIPKLNGKKDAVPGRRHKLTVRSEKVGEFYGQCTEFCGLSHANMRIRATVLSKADFAAWAANQLKASATPAAGSAAAAGQTTFIAKCAQCHEIIGKDTDGADIPRPGATAKVPLVSDAAPPLTHLMSRTVFAGAMFDLKVQDCTVKNDLPTGTPVECLNRNQLEAWLRNPPKEKPMYPADTAGKGGRGMPNLNLTETEIDDLVAYLSTLK